MKRLTVLPVWLVLTLTLCAATPAVKIIGPVGPVPPYTLVELQAEGDLTGAAVLWDVTPDDVADVKELPGGKMVFVGPPGTYKVKCTVVRLKDGQTIADRQRFVVVIGTPAPPVPPVPPIPPEPPPNPAPIPGPGFHAMIIYETADLEKLPKSQLNVLYAKSVRDYLNAKCTPTADGGKRGWYIVDANVSMDGESKLWQDALKVKRDSLPWLLISNGTSGYSGPLPATVDDTLKLLKQFGG